MGYRFIIEIDVDMADYHKIVPVDITKAIECTGLVKVKSFCAKSCPLCNPPTTKGCSCGKSNFIDDSESPGKRKDNNEKHS